MTKTNEEPSLHDYERRCLGLPPGKKTPFQQFVHGDRGILCIHTVEVKIKMGGNSLAPEITMGEEVVVQQPFDLGGYYLAPTEVRRK